jgi:hypothetical protein
MWLLRSSDGFRRDSCRIGASESGQMRVGPRSVTCHKQQNPCNTRVLSGAEGTRTPDPPTLPAGWSEFMHPLFYGRSAIESPCTTRVLVSLAAAQYRAMPARGGGSQGQIRVNGGDGIARDRSAPGAVTKCIVTRRPSCWGAIRGLTGAPRLVFRGPSDRARSRRATDR